MSDASNERAVKEARKKIELAELQKKEDILSVIETPSGYRFIKDLINQGNLLSLSVDFNSANTTYFNEGHRNYAKIIFADICEVAPAKVSQMLVELNREEE